MVWYMNTLFIYWLYLGSSPSYNDTPSVFGYFSSSIWENKVIDLLVETPSLFGNVSPANCGWAFYALKKKY